MSDTKPDFHPDKPLKCLMVQPKFPPMSFWNFVEGCKHMGAKTPSPPLGLLTVAALLPQHWTFKLMDLNCRDFDPADWAWADLICVGGMLPQQRGILEIINRAKAEGKFIAVGGPDPSSQPNLYKHADVLVVGEGESAIPDWIASWRAGQPRGLFKEREKPDVTQSPIPRYDLLDFANYAMIGIQYSRGCPFNCEFCDIIELYGRKPRTKTPEQMCAELSRLLELGYSGHVDVVDDNFIGNKRNVKRALLPALIAWNKKNGHPFFYATEASMNVADDEPLLQQLKDADFRIIFMGIETPDPDILLKTQKSQNTVRPIVERVHKLYEYGIMATAGFIMGFDGEKPGSDLSMIKLIEECGINMAMIGLLVALPNTQLTRRLLKEKRLFSFKGEMIKDETELHGGAEAKDAMVEVVDQTTAGLNFVTTRDRVEIIREFMNVVRTVYEPKAYFDRAFRLAKALNCSSKHRPRWFELRRNVLGFISVAVQMSRMKEVRWRFWRNTVYIFLKGYTVTEQVSRIHGIYAHFRRQSANLLRTFEKDLAKHEALPDEMRWVHKPAETAVDVSTSDRPAS